MYFEQTVAIGSHWLMIKRTLKNKIYELEKTIPKITIMHLVIAMQQNEGYARKDWELYSWETR